MRSPVLQTEPTMTNEQPKTLKTPNIPDDFRKPSKYEKIEREEQAIIWLNVIVFSIASIVTLLYLPHFLLTLDWATFMYVWFLVAFSTIGATAGAHRLWTHKCFKANFPLRLLLMIMNSAFFSNCIYAFARDHRAHHKYMDTDADPHNSKRGFFYCHMGWLLVKRLPVTKKRVKEIDMSDLEQDGIVMFQKNYYYILMPLFTFIIPALIPFYFWGKSFWEAFWMCGVTRWVCQLHGIWSVNSFAHLCGYRPYESKISARQNIYVSAFGFGEGWHNYHHTFPWDYKAAELPYHFNLTTAFIDFFAKIGWAWDLKTVKPEVIARRAAKTGDGSHLSDISNNGKCIDLPQNDIWGWDDKELTDKQREIALIT